MDAFGQRHVRRAIIAPVARALQRLQLRKLGFPVAQDVLRHPQVGAELADGPEGVRSFFARRQCLTYFAIRSRMIWLARNVITRRGAIGTSTPVFGLRPTR